MKRSIRKEMYKPEDLEYVLGFVAVWGGGLVLFVTLLWLL